MDVGSANEVNYDNSTKFNKVPDNIGSTQVTVTDMTGRTQETITQVIDNRFEIKDSMGISNSTDPTGVIAANEQYNGTYMGSDNAGTSNPTDPTGVI